MSTLRILACVAFLALETSACSKSSSDAAAPQPTAPTAQAAPSAPPPAAAPAVDPHELFTTRCAPCHGASGKGDGPGSSALNPKPRNYTDLAWQKGVSDDQIKKTILYGGAAVGKSPVMPASPDLESKPELLDGLVKVVRAFAGT